MNRFSRWF